MNQPRRSNLPPAIRAMEAELNAQVQAIQEGRDPRQPAQPAPTLDPSPAAAPAPSDPPAAVDPPAAPAPDPAPVGDYVPRAEFERLQRKLEEGAAAMNDAYALRQENDRLSNQVATLTTQVMNLTHRINAAPAPAAPAPAPTTIPAMPAELRDQLGDDIANRLAAWQQSVVDSVAARVEQQVRPVAETVHRSAAQRFLDDVAAAVPDMQAINARPDFAQWCNTPQVDGFGRRVVPQELFDAAIESKDSAVAIALYNRFKQEHGLAAAPTGAPPARAPAPAARSPLDQRVAPGQGPTAPPPAKPAVKTFRMSEVKQVEQQLTVGRNRLPPAELQRLNALFNEMIVAQAEGRVING